MFVVDRAGFTPLVVKSRGSGNSFVLHIMAGLPSSVTLLSSEKVAISLAFSDSIPIRYATGI